MDAEVVEVDLMNPEIPNECYSTPYIPGNLLLQWHVSTDVDLFRIKIWAGKPFDATKYGSAC